MANMPGFWSNERQPPSSPDLNPLDYAIWGKIESKVCATSHPNFKSLVVAIKKHWSKMKEPYIKKVYSRFSTGLEVIIAAKEGLMSDDCLAKG